MKWIGDAVNRLTRALRENLDHHSFPYIVYKPNREGSPFMCVPSGPKPQNGLAVLLVYNN